MENQVTSDIAKFSQTIADTLDINGRLATCALSEQQLDGLIHEVLSQIKQ